MVRVVAEGQGDEGGVQDKKEQGVLNTRFLFLTPTPRKQRWHTCETAPSINLAHILSTMAPPIELYSSVGYKKQQRDFFHYFHFQQAQQINFTCDSVFSPKKKAKPAQISESIDRGY